MALLQAACNQRSGTAFGRAAVGVDAHQKLPGLDNVSFVHARLEEGACLRRSEIEGTQCRREQAGETRLAGDRGGCGCPNTELVSISGALQV